MTHSFTLPATVAALIALCASGAACAFGDEHENEVSDVLGAKVSVGQAIPVAEQKTGGRAMRIDVDEKDNAFVYEVKTVSTDKVVDVLVDPVSANVLQVNDEGLITKIFDTDDRKEFARLSASPTTLAEAITTAEQLLNGKAIEASFDDEDGSMQYEVNVATDNAVHKVMVDSTTGRVRKVVVAENSEHDED